MLSFYIIYIVYMETLFNTILYFKANNYIFKIKINPMHQLLLNDLTDLK